MLEAIERLDCEESLYAFIQEFWQYVEPGRQFVGSQMLEEMCAHLEQCTLYMETDREEGFQNLLMNVPPGCMKSLLVNVFWPAWEWGPRNLPHLRYVNASYSEKLTLRDNGRFHAILTSPKYQKWWGDHVELMKEGEHKISNKATGWKIATSVGGLGTGERGDRFLVDDPHNIADGESDLMRTATLLWWREVVPTRLNDPEKSSKVVIMQRVHEEDVSGDILTRQLNFVHLCLPMEYDPAYRPCETPIGGDWRTQPGELLCPERYTADAVKNLKHEMGPYAVASQFQQHPSPRGGGIIKEEWWQLWDEEYAQRLGIFDPEVDTKLPWPPMEFVVAYLDTAFKEKQESDYHAMVVLGVWRDENDLPKIMAMGCWKKRLTLHGSMPPRMPDEDDKAYLRRTRKHWGLVELVAHTCKHMRIDRLIIEDSAKGQDVKDELIRLFSTEGIAIEAMPAIKDKISCAYAVQPLFSGGTVYCPEMDWAADLMKNAANFPKITHDDDVDALIRGLKWLRETGWALRREERAVDLERELRLETNKPVEPLYDV